MVMVMVRAEGEKSGCIKKSQGPWLVHKTTKNGCVVTKYRYPSEKERQNNKQRERKRRSITKKIFAGLRAHGNYQLPKHADSNDLLKALCEEAGLHVDEDGNVHKKHHIFNTPSIINSNFGAGNNKHGEDKYCKCGDFQTKDTGLSMGFSFAEQDINLALSLS